MFPRPACKLFQIHGSKFKFLPLRNASQASHVGIARFSLASAKTLNHFLAFLVNKAIENLKVRLNRHCFLSITATPQANLLIDTLDVLSPDFGVLVDPGNGYCGLDVYHSDNKYTKKIPDNETSLLDDGIPQSFMENSTMTRFTLFGAYLKSNKRNVYFWNFRWF